MKFLLKLLGVLVALVVVVYFGVIIATGFVIENQLAKLNDYLHQDPNNEFLNNIEVAYEKGESSIFTKNGTLKVTNRYAKVATAQAPFTCDIGFLKVDATLDISKVFNLFKEVKEFLPQNLNYQKLHSSVNVHANVFDLAAFASVAAHGSYLKGKHQDFNLNSRVDVTTELNPTLKAEVLNYYNDKLVNVGKANVQAKIYGLTPIKSLGEGSLKAEGVGASNYSFKTLNVDYETVDYDDKGNFNLGVKANASGSLDYLQNFETKLLLSKFNLDRILNSQKYLKNENDKAVDAILQTLTKAQVYNFDFKISKKLARLLLSEDSTALLFKATANASFKHPDYLKTLNGKVLIKTNTKKGIATLMQPQKDGSYATEVVFKNGNYTLNGLSLMPEVLSKFSFGGFDKESLDTSKSLIDLNLNQKGKTKSIDVNKALDKLNKNASKLKLFN